MKKKVVGLISIIVLAMLTFSSCGNAETNETNETSEANETKTDVSVEMTNDLNENMAYLAFSTGNYKVVNGTIRWDSGNQTWEVEFPSDFGPIILSGTYTDDGKLTVLEDNSGGYALEGIPFIQEKFIDNLEGHMYAPLVYSSEKGEVTDGIIYWNVNTQEWNAEFPSDFGNITISGTYDEDGMLTALEDNADGYAMQDVQLIQPVFTNALAHVYAHVELDGKTDNELSLSIKEVETNNKWKDNIIEIAKTYDPNENSGDIIFYGASNFALWESMEEDLLPFSVQNHAFGGSTDKDLELWAPYMLYAYDPHFVFFQTGSNDYVESEASTNELKVKEAMDFKCQMFEEFHEQMPDATFVVMSGILLPGRAEYVDMTLDINSQLKALCDEKDYMIFVDAENLTYDRETMSFVDDAEALFVDDQIHLTDSSRIKWAQEWILPLMEELDMPQKNNIEQ